MQTLQDNPGEDEILLDKMIEIQKQFVGYVLFISEKIFLSHFLSRKMGWSVKEKYTTMRHKSFFNVSWSKANSFLIKLGI